MFSPCHLGEWEMQRNSGSFLSLASFRSIARTVAQGRPQPQAAFGFRTRCTRRGFNLRLIGEKRPGIGPSGCSSRFHLCRATWVSRPPNSALLPFFGEGSPTKIDCREKGYPYSNLSTGDPVNKRARFHQLEVTPMVTYGHPFVGPD